MLRCLTLTLSIVAILTIAQTAQEHGLEHLERHWGCGWGDGYHARTACPPRRGLVGAPCPTCHPNWANQPSPTRLAREPAAASPSTRTATLFPHWDKVPARSR